jgi:hypothetical protein
MKFKVGDLVMARDHSFKFNWAATPKKHSLNIGRVLGNHIHGGDYKIQWLKDDDYWFYRVKESDKQLVKLENNSIIRILYGK